MWYFLSLFWKNLVKKRQSSAVNKGDDEDEVASALCFLYRFDAVE